MRHKATEAQAAESVTDDGRGQLSSMPPDGRVDSTGARDEGKRRWARRRGRKEGRRETDGESSMEGGYESSVGETWMMCLAQRVPCGTEAVAEN